MIIDRTKENDPSSTQRQGSFDNGQWSRRRSRSRGFSFHPPIKHCMWLQQRTITCLAHPPCFLVLACRHPPTLSKTCQGDYVQSVEVGVLRLFQSNFCSTRQLAGHSMCGLASPSGFNLTRSFMRDHTANLIAGNTSRI